MEKDSIRRMYSLFKDITDILSDLIKFLDKEEKGEKITEEDEKEVESLMGRFTFKMIELSGLK